MKDGIAAVDIDLRGAKSLYLVVEDGGNGNSCDWADWGEGKLSGPGGDVALTELTWSDAKTGWGQVRRNLNCDGGPLVIAGKAFEHGIGTHAPSEIAYTLPVNKFERLRVSVGPDERGVKQAGGTSVRFKVYAQIPPDPAQYAALDARVVDAKLSPSERKAAAQALCATRDGGLYVLATANKGNLDEDTKHLLSEAIFLNPDLAVRALASEQFKRPAGSMPAVAELEKLHGDERNGERVFFGATASCSKCHVISGRGGDIGPDLSGVRKKYAPGAVFDAILNPSAGIAFGFDTWMFETSDDRVVSGFLLADRAAPRTLGPPITLFSGRDFSGWTFFLDQPGAKMSDVWSIQDGVLDCKGNPIGYLRTEATYEDFVLELDWRFPAGGDPGNSGVLLRRVGADKVWPKSVEAQLEHRSAGDIWNIDEVPMVVDVARTSGRHTVKVAPCNELSLGEWNHYKITLDRGDLKLEVNGTVQNTATWVERVPGNICLQSEGSRIQFRNIVLRKLE